MIGWIIAGVCVFVAFVCYACVVVGSRYDKDD